MKKRRNRSDSSAWMALPLYIFTIVFVVCPLIYMVALSFATPSRVYDLGQLQYPRPVYGKYAETITEISGACILEHICGITETAFTSTIVIFIGYPFASWRGCWSTERKRHSFCPRRSG